MPGAGLCLGQKGSIYCSSAEKVGWVAPQDIEQGCLYLEGKPKYSLIVTPPNAGETDYEVTQGGGQWEGKKQLSCAITRRTYVIIS